MKMFNDPDYDHAADDYFYAVVDEIIAEMREQYKMMDWAGKYRSYCEKWAQKRINAEKDYYNEVSLGI